MANIPHPHWILVDAEPINKIDITGIDMLHNPGKELVTANIELHFARVKTYVYEFMSRAGLDNKFNFYPSVQAGVDAYLASPERNDNAGSSIASL